MENDVDVEGLAEALGRVTHALLTIADWIDADRNVVRDGNGRIVAVERKKPASRAPGNKPRDLEAAVGELGGALHTLVASIDAERELVSKKGKIVGSRRKGKSVL